MRNKFCVLTLCVGLNVWGQEIQIQEVVRVDSIVSVNETPGREERNEIYYNERNFDSGFKDNYKNKKFNYDRKPKPKRNWNFPTFTLPPGLTNILMYSILGVIIVVVIYFIFKNSGGFSFTRKKPKIAFETSVEENENIEDISQNDFAGLIQKAKSEKDFRKAVRFYYLWVLQKMSDKNLIIWNKDKTDYDYFLELGNHPVKEDFSQNTYIYDCTWYGNFELDEKQFNLAETIFKRTLTKLN